MYRSVDGTEAIKTLDCDDADSPLLIRANGQIALKPDVLKVCHTEVALVWSFSHPNICRVYGGWHSCSQHGAASKHCYGLPALQFEGGHVTRPHQVHILQTAQSAHTAAAGRGAGLAAQLRRPKVYHCDVKPDNILLSESLDVKLTDFGLSEERKVSVISVTGGTAMGTHRCIVRGNAFRKRSLLICIRLTAA